MAPRGHLHDWILFIAGVLLALGFKCARYVYEGKKRGVRTKDSLFEWFFEATLANGVSWFTTLFIVLPFGGVYIDKVSVGAGWILNLPVHWTFSLGFGGLMEYIAPNLMKWIVAKLPGGE